MAITTTKSNQEDMVNVSLETLWAVGCSILASLLMLGGGEWLSLTLSSPFNRQLGLGL
jgi:hypothetical protein